MIVQRGHLRTPADAPVQGETSELLVEVDGRPVVEQILSGAMDGPTDYLEARHEWVAVLAGGALMEVGGEAVRLGAGQWMVLPAGVPHRLVEVEPGTSWLAVHFDAGGAGGAVRPLSTGPT